MQPRARIGLIVGVIRLVLNTCASVFVGKCGSLFSRIAGAVAGFFAAQQEKLPAKNEGARARATAGGIAGGLIILGQLIGGVRALFFLQANGAQMPFGQIPSTADPSATQMMYYLTGAATALCFGVIGALLAAGAGAGAGYLATSDTPLTNPM